MLHCQRDRADVVTRTRALAGRIAALEPLLEEAIGELSYVRFHALTLTAGFSGACQALTSCYVIAQHLAPLSREAAHTATASLVGSYSSNVHILTDSPVASPETANQNRTLCEEIIDGLSTNSNEPPSQLLLSSEATKIFLELARLYGAMALLGAPPQRPAYRAIRNHQSLADWMPAGLNAAGAFIVVVAVEAFWVATAWPERDLSIVFVAVAVALLPPKGDAAYGSAIAFALGTSISTICAAVAAFALLPKLSSFSDLCVVIGLFLVPPAYNLASQCSRHC